MSSKTSLDNLIIVTSEILQTKYPTAEFAFLAGSILRGEGTAFSDLDIVIIYEELPNAFRESFCFQDFPVETFVHTTETLNYFFETDAKSFVPSLAMMVAEGIEVPAKSDLSEKLKHLANDYLNNPPKISDEEIRNIRCWITDLIDDIREPRSKEELTASGTTLYGAMADFYLRTNGVWSAKSKSIPRNLHKLNAEFCREFRESFEELFVAGKSERVIKLSEIILEKYGGFLFDGMRLDAPAEFKKPIK